MANAVNCSRFFLDRAAMCSRITPLPWPGACRGWRCDVLGKEGPDFMISSRLLPPHNPCHSRAEERTRTPDGTMGVL